MCLFLELGVPYLLLGPPALVVPSALSRIVWFFCPLSPSIVVCMERVTVWLLSHFIREVSATLEVILNSDFEKLRLITCVLQNYKAPWGPW